MSDANECSLGNHPSDQEGSSYPDKYPSEECDSSYLLQRRLPYLDNEPMLWSTLFKFTLPGDTCYREFYSTNKNALVEKTKEILEGKVEPPKSIKAFCVMLLFLASERGFDGHSSFLRNLKSFQIASLPDLVYNPTKLKETQAHCFRGDPVNYRTVCNGALTLPMDKRSELFKHFFRLSNTVQNLVELNYIQVLHRENKCISDFIFGEVWDRCISFVSVSRGSCKHRDRLCYELLKLH